METEAPKAEASSVPVIRVSVQRQLENAVMIFETYTAQDIEPKALDNLLDKLNGAAQRQSLYADLEREKRNAYNDSFEIERMETQLKEIDTLYAERASEHAQSGRRGEYKIGEAEHKQRASFVTQIESVRKKHERALKKAAELEAQLGA